MLRDFPTGIIDRVLEEIRVGLTLVDKNGE